MTEKHEALSDFWARPITEETAMQEALSRDILSFSGPSISSDISSVICISRKHNSTPSLASVDPAMSLGDFQKAGTVWHLRRLVGHCDYSSSSVLFIWMKSRSFFLQVRNFCYCTVSNQIESIRVD